MTRRTLVRCASAATVAAALTLSGGPTAAAATTIASTGTSTSSPSPTPAVSLPALKTRCNTEVQRRLASLAADRGFIEQAADLTASDRAALLQIVSTDEPALTALDAKIQADTTLKQARQDCELIVTDFRIYVLQEPKMHEVIAADTVTAANASLRSLAGLLGADISAAKLTPAQKQAAQEALNDLYAKVAASEAAVGGVSAAVLPLTPAGYPNPDVSVLKQGEQSIHSARTDLRGARADVDTILHILGH